jgi:hypothetical protein
VRRCEAGRGWLGAESVERTGGRDAAFNFQFNTPGVLEKKMIPGHFGGHWTT